MMEIRFEPAHFALKFFEQQRNQATKTAKLCSFVALLFNHFLPRRNAVKPPRLQGKHRLFFAPWHLCVFALFFSVGAGFAFTNTLAHRTGFV